MPSVAVEVASQRFDIPFECPCCGATPTAEVTIAPKTSGPTLLFPYCERCVNHSRGYDAARMSSTLLMLIAIVFAALIGFAFSPLAGLGAFAIGAFAAYWLRMWWQKAATLKRAPSCASTPVAVTFEGWSGTTSAFTFESPTFAARFAEQNKSLLANQTPQLQRLVEGYHKARLAIPTPAVAAGTAPPPLDHAGWMKRVESTHGILARRVQLQRALEMTEMPSQRRELVQLVARAELERVTSRLAQMSNPADKKRLIAQTIDEIRADNIFDELQAAEIAELEARAAEP